MKLILTVFLALLCASAAKAKCPNLVVFIAGNFAPEHPILKGMPACYPKDKLHRSLRGPVKNLDVLGQGRVFHTTLAAPAPGILTEGPAPALREVITKNPPPPRPFPL